MPSGNEKHDLDESSHIGKPGATFNERFVFANINYIAFFSD